jgi:hypothetical protein
MKIYKIIIGLLFTFNHCFINNIKAQSLGNRLVTSSFGVEISGYDESRYENIHSLSFEIPTGGFYDSQGTAKNKIENYQFGRFSEGLIWIKEPFEYFDKGYYNSLGQKTISIIYDSINNKFYPLGDFMGDFHSGYAKVTNGEYQNQRIGYMDRLGNQTIPVKYQEGGDFNSGLTFVKLNGKFGFINTRNRVKIPFIYDGARDFSEALAAVKYSGKWGFIDTNGKTAIQPIYQSTLSFHNKYCRVKLNNKYGIIDQKNNKIIDFKYDFISNIDSNICVFRNGNEWGVINTQNQVLINGLKSCVQANCNLIICRSSDGFFAIDSKGTKLNAINFDTLTIINEDFLIGKKNKLYYHLNHNGKIDTNKIYSEILSKKYYDFDFYHVLKDQNNWVNKRLYRGYHSLPSSGVFIFCKNKKYGILSPVGKLISEPIYDDILQFNDGFIWTKLDSKVSIFNENGSNITLKRNYHEVSHFHSVDKVAKVWIIENGISKFGFIDINGIEIIPPIYTTVDEFKAGYSLVGLGQELGYKGGKYGVINLKNEIVIPIIYEYEQLARKSDNSWVLVTPLKEQNTALIAQNTSPSRINHCTYKIASKPINWQYIDNRKYCKYCSTLLPNRKLTKEEISSRKKNAMVHLVYSDLTNHWLLSKGHDDITADLEYQAYIEWQKTLGLSAVELMIGNSVLNMTSMMSMFSAFSLVGAPSVSEVLTEINLYKTTDDEFCNKYHRDLFYRR